MEDEGRAAAARATQRMTTPEAIEKAALELFAERGFDATLVEDIAAAAGISRRTFFRYFPSKNDIPFGNFAVLIDELDAWFAARSDDEPVFSVIADSALRFNRLHSDGVVAHRERMKLILHTPALQANAALHHREWAAVVARYAARRLDADPQDFVPQLISQLSLGAANAAYGQWLRDESADLVELMRQAFAMTQRVSELDQRHERRRPQARRMTWR